MTKHANYQYGVFWIGDDPVEDAPVSTIKEIMDAASDMDDLKLAAPILDSSTLGLVTTAVYYHDDPQ